MASPVLNWLQRSNKVKITERAVKLELSLQHRPDAILNLGGLLTFIHKSNNSLKLKSNVLKN